MLPANLSFTVPNATCLKRHIINPTNTIDIKSIVIEQKDFGTKGLARIELDSINASWSQVNKVLVQNAVSNYNNGVFVVKLIDFNNKYIYIVNKNAVEQLSAAGDVTPYGVIDLASTLPGESIRNNNNQEIATCYTINDGEEHYFIFNPFNERLLDIPIQIVNIDRTNSLGEIELLWSLDFVNWLKFDPAITIAGIDAGESAGIFIPYGTNKLWIKIVVNGISECKYYIMIG